MPRVRVGRVPSKIALIVELKRVIPLLSFRLEIPWTPRLTQIQHSWLLLPIALGQRSKQALSMLVIVLLETVQAWRMAIRILRGLRGLLL